MSVNKSILLVDPSLLFDERKTDVIIALAKSKDYRIALPDEMVSLLKGRDFNELYQLLVDWDPRYAKVDRDWIFSDRIIDKTQILTEYTTTLSSLRVDLKAEQQVRYLEFQKILGEGSPLTRRISKELVRTSGALNCRVLSFSRNVRLLFSRLRGIVTISKEAYHWIKKVKLDIKKNLEKHGWVGVFYVLLFGIVTGLPFMGASLVEEIIGSAALSTILAVITNGHNKTNSQRNRPRALTIKSHVSAYDFLKPTSTIQQNIFQTQEVQTQKDKVREISYF